MLVSNLWISPSGEVQTYHLAEWTNHQTANALTVDSTGTVWAIIGHLIYRFENDGFHVANIDPSIQDDVCNALLTDRAGNLWLGSKLGNLWRMARGGIQRFTTRHGLPHNIVRAVTPRHGGGLWLATFGGVATLDQGHFHALDVPGLSPTRLGASLVFEDRQHRLWSGPWESQDNGELSQRFTVTERDNHGDWKALHRYIGDSCRAATQDANGDVWVVSPPGLVRCFPGLRTFTRDAIGPVDFLTGVYVSYRRPQEVDYYAGPANLWAWKGGDRWIDTGHGRGPLLPDEIRALGIPFDDRYVPETLPASFTDGYNTRGALTARDGSLWFGSADGVQHFANNAFETWNETQGLAGNDVRSLYEDSSGTIWIGTKAGLSRFLNGKFVTLDEACGLPDQRILGICEDKLGHLWFNSNTQIFRVPLDQLNAYPDGLRKTVEAFSLSDNVSSLPTAPYDKSQPSICVDEQGVLWFATGQGLLRVDPNESITPAFPTPTVVIELFQSQETSESQPPLLRASVSTHKRQLPAGAGETLHFRYTAPSLSSPLPLNFRHRLLGHDQDWWDNALGQEAYYTNIGPGDYTFQAEASFSGKDPSQTSFSFTIVPHWYETKVARSLALLGLIIGGFTARSWWAQQQIKRARVTEREEIARDLHDNVGAELQTMHNWIGCLRQQSGSPEETLSKLDSAVLEAKHSLQQVRATVSTEPIAISSAIESINHLIRRMVEPTGIQLSVLTSEERIDGWLTPDRFRTLTFAVKEIVRNATAHAAASQFTAAWRPQRSLLSLNLSDNGRGILSEELPTLTDALDGQGLTNVKGRIKEVHGTIEIHSTRQGTSIKLALPIDP